MSNPIRRLAFQNGNRLLQKQRFFRIQYHPNLGMKPHLITQDQAAIKDDAQSHHSSSLGSDLTEPKSRTPSFMALMREAKIGNISLDDLQSGVPLDGLGSPGGGRAYAEGEAQMKDGFECKVMVAKAVSMKSTVRNWCKRRIMSAVKVALSKQGLSVDGSPLPSGRETATGERKQSEQGRKQQSRSGNGISGLLILSAGENVKTAKWEDVLFDATVVVQGIGEWGRMSRSRSSSGVPRGGRYGQPPPGREEVVRNKPRPRLTMGRWDTHKEVRPARKGV